MYKLDDILVDWIFNPIAKRFQLLTGKNCYYLAQICFIMCAIASIMIGVYDFMFAPYTLSEKLRLAAVLFINSNLFLLAGNWMHEERVKFEKMRKKALCNGRLEYQFFRLGLMLLILYINFMIPLIKDDFGKQYFEFISLVLTGFELALYFFACTPLPSGESKIGECVTNFKASFAKRELQKIRYK
ncbi:MAG: hypothetical protein ACD_3C00171G0001 [uncultured bacterium (gcode 4)]|uniref:Uncharacterized protein n=1 Tax=uncultured bacterium (gcode 4) TaxID=1234023 RepID=K2G0M2_9BACT|nr:MAG: hypothetical protein ACD_3C00171G0001 [uncultured bacterium (gcode 4)]